MASGYYLSHWAPGLPRMRCSHLCHALCIKGGEGDRDGDGDTEPHCSRDRCLSVPSRIWANGAPGTMCSIPAPSQAAISAGTSLLPPPPQQPQALQTWRAAATISARLASKNVQIDTFSNRFSFALLLTQLPQRELLFGAV